MWKDDNWMCVLCLLVLFVGMPAAALMIISQREAEWQVRQKEILDEIETDKAEYKQYKQYKQRLQALDEEHQRYMKQLDDASRPIEERFPDIQRTLPEDDWGLTERQRSGGIIFSREKLQLLKSALEARQKLQSSNRISEEEMRLFRERNKR